MGEYRDELGPILETCLQNLQAGRWTVEQCLAEFPQEREALEPLLRAAVSLRLAQSLRVRPAFRSAARSRLAARLQRSRRKPTAPKSGRPQALFPRRLVSFGLALVVVLILAAGSAGTIYAANGSLPGQPLYGVKLTVEQTQLSLSPPGQAVGLRMKFAARRLDEAEQLAARGDDADLGVALNGYNQLVGQITQLLDSTSDDQTLQSVGNALAANQARLQALLATVPAPAQPGITQAIEASQHGQERAAQARSKHGKPNTPPGDASSPTPTPTGGKPSDGTGDGKGKPADTPGGGNSGGKGKPTDVPGGDKSPSSDKGQANAKGKGSDSGGGMTCANGTILPADTVAEANDLAAQYNRDPLDVLALFCSGLTAGQVEAQLAPGSNG